MTTASNPPHLALPAEPVLHQPVTLHYFDTDAAGVVHNVAYLRLVEVARTALAEALGWSLREMQETGIVPVVARTTIDYLQPLRLVDRVSIESRLTAIERVRFHLAFNFWREGTPSPVARCEQTMVAVQLATGRPQPMRKAWVQAFPQLLKHRPAS